MPLTVTERKPSAQNSSHRYASFELLIGQTGKQPKLGLIRVIGRVHIRRIVGQVVPS